MANPALGGAFDPNDMTSWYFQGLSRAEATRLLLNETESGVFLVRDSKTITGDFVLCVRENERVSHYIINRVVSADGTVRFRIGDQLFADMAALLSFYRLHYLDTTPLTRPLPPPQGKAASAHHQVLELVIAKFDFTGSDLDDLPFQRGERLMVINRDEEQWWTARNAQGRTGSIPVPYVRRILSPSGVPYPPSEALNHINEPASPPTNNRPPPPSNLQRTLPALARVRQTRVPNAYDRTALKLEEGDIIKRTLPALARVRQTRVPNAYDRTALKLEEGDIIKVTKININGQWEGELNGKSGHFPFTYVEFLDEHAAS